MPFCISDPSPPPPPVLPWLALFLSPQRAQEGLIPREAGLSSHSRWDWGAEGGAPGQGWGRGWRGCVCTLPPPHPAPWFQAWEQGRDRVSQINPHLGPGYQLKFLPSLGASEQPDQPWGGTSPARPQEALGGQRRACPNALVFPGPGQVGGGEGEGQGVRCHCQDRPWTLAHEEQAQEDLADLPYR